MPDSEVFKLILQLGSFGLLAIIVVWLLWKGAPMLTAAIEAKDKVHAEAFECVVEKFDEALERQATKHDAAVDRVVTANERQLAKRDTADERKTAAVEKLAEVVGRLSDRVEKIERRTDEYPAPPKRRPKPEEN